MVVETRREIAQEYHILLRQKDGIIENQQRVLESMRPALIDRELATRITNIYNQAKEVTMGGEHYRFDRPKSERLAGRHTHMT